MTTATSASDRYDEARAALHKIESTVGILTEKRPSALDWEPDEFDLLRAAQSVIPALRALIEPPATEETPEQIAERIYVRLDAAILTSAKPHPEVMSGIRAALEDVARAGIQAAWESWEGENAPGVRMVTREQYNALIQAIADDDESERGIETFASNILDALGMTP